MPDVITCISEGDDPCGRRRQGVNRSDDAPAGQRQGVSRVPRLARPARWSQPEKPVCEPHDSTGEPGAGNRHAGFGERGEETCPWDSDCGPVRKRRMSHRLPTGYAPPLDSTLGPGLAVPGDGTVDEARMPPGQRVVIESELRQAAGAKVLDQDVGGGDQLMQPCGARLRLQIERDALLVPVQSEKKRAEPAAMRRPGARIVALGRLFHLDHFGTHVAQHHGAVGPREDPCQVDDTQSGKGWHRVGCTPRKTRFRSGGRSG